MKENNPHILGTEKVGKLLFRVLYPCHHRDDTDITVQHY